MDKSSRYDRWFAMMVLLTCLYMLVQFVWNVTPQGCRSPLGSASIR